jgi:hypothetical protein
MPGGAYRAGAAANRAKAYVLAHLRLGQERCAGRESDRRMC